jgi:hypothetical protein
MKRTLLRSLVLPGALPFVVGWAERHASSIRHLGFPLDSGGRQDAQALGVGYPERIRVMLVDTVPEPGLPPLRWASAMSGLSLSSAAGLSLGYGLYIRRDCFPDRDLIAHECVHTAQCERLGGLRPFLERYLIECLEFGYLNAPLEQEAVRLSCRLRAGPPWNEDEGPPTASIGGCIPPSGGRY